MQAIWKFTLSPCTSSTWLDMPADAKVLSVGQVEGDICLWAQVDTVMKPTRREFVPVMTGQQLTDADMRHMTFVGTVVFIEHPTRPPVVVHVYELAL